MIIPIEGGVDAFTASAYGIPDPMTMQWCNHRVQQARATLLPEVQQYFNSAVGTVFDDINYREIARIAKATSGRIDSVWVMDVIRPSHTLQELQNAPPVMVGWIMAHPTVRKLYHEQQIAGYDQYYTDHAPTEHSKDHDQYREVINGIFLPTGNGDEEEAVEWLGEFDDSTLDITDKSSIIETWDAVLAHIKAGREDPTSTYNAML